MFFREEALPVGSMPLTAERSIAVDRRSIPYGTPVWMKSTEPQTSFDRLVLANWRAASSNPCKCGPSGHAEPDVLDRMTLTCRRAVRIVDVNQHAPRQTGGCVLHSTRRPAALHYFWAARTASGVRAAASLGGDLLVSGGWWGARPGLADAAGGN